MMPNAVFVTAVAVVGTQHISTLQQILEKSWKHAKDLYTCFVDLGKVYGRVPREKLWGLL